jgi:hypothetical protein
LSLVSIVLSGRGLCDELITRLEEFYRLWCVVVCDLENFVNEEAQAHWGTVVPKKKSNQVPGWLMVIWVLKKFSLLIKQKVHYRFHKILPVLTILLTLLTSAVYHSLPILFKFRSMLTYSY